MTNKKISFIMGFRFNKFCRQILNFVLILKKTLFVSVNSRCLVPFCARGRYLFKFIKKKKKFELNEMNHNLLQEAKEIYIKKTFTKTKIIESFFLNLYDAISTDVHVYPPPMD